MKEWFKWLDLKSLQQADKKWGEWALFLFTFADSSFFPLPAQTFFLLLILMNSRQSVRYIILGTLGTFTGALAGYLIGHFALLNLYGQETAFGKFIINHMPGFSESAYNKIHILYSRWDFWILFIASFTPIPFGVFSISSGVFETNLVIFCLATFISQTLKFIILAVLTNKFGLMFKRIFEYNLRPIALAASVCIIIIIVVVEFT
jgi:membrane protein YqaA with SNARE-associated domain